MHLFEVIAVDAEPASALPVFAKSYDLAVQQYLMWWMHHRDGDLPDLEVRKRNPSWQGLNAALLVKALELDLTGVGHFNSNQGWTIYTPEDERAGCL